MNPAWRHRLRRGRFVLGGALAALAIALAALMALAQLLLPLAAHYPQRVADMLGARLHQPVSFASMEGHWQPSGPLLVLHQVRIGGAGAAPALTLPAAEVKLDFGALLWPSRHWVNLRLRGLKLDLVRDAGGAWHVSGLAASGAAGAREPVSLDNLPGNLWLDDLQLEIRDAVSGRRHVVHAGPLRLSNDGRRLRFAGELRRGDAAQALHVAGYARTDGSDGRIYLAGRDFDLGAMFHDVAAGGYGLKQGRGDFRLWLRWQQQRVVGFTARLDLHDLTLHGPAAEVHLPSLQGLLQLRRDGAGTHVLLASGPRGAARIDVGHAEGDVKVVARARDMDVAPLLPLAALLPTLSPSTAQWLAQAHPRGHLAQASLRWSRSRGIDAVAARFDHLGFDAVGSRPGIEQLRGVLRGDGEALALQLPAQPLVVDYPHTFRKALAFTSVHGDLVAWHGGGAWHIGSDALDFEGIGINGQVRGSVALADAGGAPFLDMYASLSQVDIAAAKQLLPVHAMSPQAVAWLDRGLLAGSLDRASVLLRGNLADWPFLQHQGRFEAHAAISGLALDYGADWPHAEDIALEASFVDNGMLVEVGGGQSMDVKVDKAVASIPDFSHSELLLSAQGHGAGAELLDFVRNSPVGAAHADALKGLELGGRGDFNFAMVLPLSRNAKQPFTLGGRVELSNADLDNADWQLHLGQLAGTLAFDAHGFRARDMGATFNGQPVSLDMAVGPATGDPARSLAARMQGNFSVAQLVRGRDELAPLASIADGSARFDVGFDIAEQPDGTSTQTLSVDSDLRGIALDLPAPLGKEAPDVLPLHLQLGLPFAGNQLRVALGDVLRAQARLPAGTRPLAADIMLGGTWPSAPVPAQGLRIGGHATLLDISGWAQLALAGSGGDVGTGSGLESVDVHADTAELFGERFRDLRVRLKPGATETVLALDGPQIKGSLSVPADELDKRGIVARFARLYWPSPEHAATASAAAPAASASVAAPAAAASAPVSPAPVAPTATAGIAPSSLPPLHLWVGDLRFGSGHLGQARFESWPTAQGMHIDQLRTQSKSVHIAASGDWIGNATSSHTHLAIDFSAQNLGRMLDAFGFDGLFSGGETRAHLDATWPGAPSSFALADVEGTLSVDIGKGRIPEVKPGVGRLFGLMSVAELPRRLSLDFGDVFGKGFGFDSIKGDFRLHDGNAYTDNLAIKGAAASISIRGRTGLRAHDYDQQVVAIPHIGNSLPVVGAVVAGPVGAAAGLAVQGLLGKGLNKVASARYHITGSWDAPKITRVDKHAPPMTAKPASASSAAAPAAGSSAPR